MCALVFAHTRYVFLYYFPICFICKAVYFYVRACETKKRNVLVGRKKACPNQVFLPVSARLFPANNAYLPITYIHTHIYLFAYVL